MTRLIDVANEVGMSRAAVARVLLGTGEGKIRVSEAATKKIQAAALKLNYRPNLAAQQLKGKGSKTLAVIAIDSSPRVMIDRIYAMERRAWQNGYDLLLCRTPYLKNQELQPFLQRLQQRHLDGLIVLDQISDQQREDQNNDIFKGHKAVFHGYAISEGDHGVQPDIKAGTALATQHCIDQQRQRIALATFKDYDERISIWSHTLQANGMKALSKLQYLHNPQPSKRLDTDAALAKKIVNQLVIKDKADAIICENDFWAARILNECQSRGIRVPDDLALVGYNNLDFTQFTSPPLTSIDECNEVIGYALVDQILTLIQKKTDSNHHPVKIITPKLIHRSSS